MPNDDWNILWNNGFQIDPDLPYPPWVDLAAQTGPRPKILYVDDHSTSREMMLSMLEESGFDVAGAMDGWEGVEKTRQWRPDIILMDLRMPRMDGFKAIETIRACEEIKRIPIIVTSAWANAKHKKRSLAAGANEHLSKPVNYRLLMTVIRRYLEQS